jgi:hypothetical protein
VYKAEDEQRFLQLRLLNDAFFDKLQVAQEVAKFY